MVLVGWLCGTGGGALAAALSIGLLMLVALLTRFERAFLLLGALLPIYEVGPIPSSAFLIARIVLIAAIVLRDVVASRMHLYKLPQRRWWLYALALVGTAVVHPSGVAAYFAVTFLAMALLGNRIASTSDYRLLFTGFRIGVFLSAIALLLGVSGLLELSDVTQTRGHPGLSYRSTAFAYEAAIVLVMWFWWSSPRQTPLRKLAWIVEGVVVGAALLGSGGRGGLLALVVAMLVLPLSAGKVKATLRFTGIAALGLAIVYASGLSTLSIDRLFPTDRDRRIAVQDQYGSGRGDLYRASLAQARENPLVGSGFNDSSLRALSGGGGPADGTNATVAGGQRSAHLLLLALFIAGGVGLAVSALLVLAEAARNSYAIASRSPRESWWIAAGIVIYLVNSLLEVGGGL
ncbi:MAG TPA: hypothetical protein VJ777_30555, partial [Mycobacterium sp.]|nr:hypothetical protein [Mycobacterium sp.]